MSNDLVPVEYVGPDLLVRIAGSDHVVAPAGVERDTLMAAGLHAAADATYGGVLEVDPVLAGQTPDEDPPYGRGLLAQVGVWRRPVVETEVALEPEESAPAEDEQEGAAPADDEPPVKEPKPIESAAEPKSDDAPAPHAHAHPHKAPAKKAPSKATRGRGRSAHHDEN